MARPLEKHTLHVLDVYPSSPASAAGLDAFNDYILGVGDLLYDGPDEFGEIVAYNCGRPVRLYVYSSRTEAVIVIDSYDSIHRSSAPALTSLGR